MNKSTQANMVLDYIRDFGAITSFEAFQDLGITRLAAVIHIIRHRYNINVKTDYVTAKNRYGNPVTFARYSIAA